MADPVTLGAISLGATAAGAGVSAFGSLYKGSAESDMYKYQASVAALNQKISLQNADYARQAGEVSAQASGLKTKSEMALSRAQFGAGNIAVGSGSASRVIQSEHEIGVQDQNIIRNNAAWKAYGYDVEAAKYGSEVGLYNKAARTSKTSGMIGAVSSILGGAGSVSSKWSQGTQTGIFS